jgi:hypothetical protein
MQTAARRHRVAYHHHELAAFPGAHNRLITRTPLRYWRLNPATSPSAHHRLTLFPLANLWDRSQNDSAPEIGDCVFELDSTHSNDTAAM